MLLRLLFIGLAFFYVPVGFYAKAQDHEVSKDSAVYFKKYVLPLVIYTPETQFGFGGFGVTLYHPKISKKGFTRTSNMELAVLYTTRKQTIFLPKYTIFTAGEKYYFEGLVEILLNFPEFYYGIGDKTPIKNQEQVDYQLVAWEAKWLRKVCETKKIFLGLETRFFNRSDVNIKPGGLLSTEKTTGYNGSTTVGLGPAITWDERDNVVNPSKGVFLDIRAAFNRKVLGGTVAYNRFLVDFRKYFNVFPKRRQILAFELYGSTVIGNAPWKELSELGGPRIMRGFFRGRFRDKSLLAFQSEYRVPIYKWFGVVGFAGIGQVSRSPSFVVRDLKMSYGGGLRVMLNKKEKLNLRLDYGRGDKDRKGFFYLGFAESF